MRRVVITSAASPAKAVPEDRPLTIDAGSGKATRRATHRFRRFGQRALSLLIGLVALGAFGAAVASADSFYIGDQTDNTYDTFDLAANAPLSTFIPFTKGGPTGPRGILPLKDGTFLVAYQNPGLPFAGEVDQFDRSGHRLRTVVSSSDPHAPFAPRGIILGPDKSTLYVADFGKDNVGAVEMYNLGTGKFLGKLNFDNWVNSSSSNGEFHPRGLVFGSDGTLYLTLFSEKDFQHLGWILSYNTGTGAISVVARYNRTATDQCRPYLSRPEGVAVGPDGDVYVVGRQPDTSLGYDKILAFDPTSGACVHSINLEAQPGEAHTYARALIFGPGGNLELPMTVCTTATADGTAICPSVVPGQTDAGSVRSYDVSTGRYSDIVPEVVKGTASDPSVYYTGEPTGSAVGWWYLTLSATNPTTLEYSG